MEKKKLLIVEKAIEEANEDLAYSMADSAYIGLVVHLALAMERILQGENIAIDPSYLDELRAEPEYEVAEKNHPTIREGLSGRDSCCRNRLYYDALTRCQATS
ncbi:hypothetical protein GCM10020331_085550 [Ectobacillus funiculus]